MTFVSDGRPRRRRSFTSIRPSPQAWRKAFCAIVRPTPASGYGVDRQATDLRTAISPGVKLAAIFAGTAPDIA